MKEHIQNRLNKLARNSTPLDVVVELLGFTSVELVAKELGAVLIESTFYFYPTQEGLALLK